MKCCTPMPRPSVSVKLTVPSDALVLEGREVCPPAAGATVTGSGVSTGGWLESRRSSVTVSGWFGSACGADVTSTSSLPAGVQLPARQMSPPPQPAPSGRLPVMTHAGTPALHAVAYDLQGFGDEGAGA